MNEAGKQALTLLDNRLKREGKTLEKGIDKMFDALPKDAAADLQGVHKVLRKEDGTTELLLERMRAVFKGDATAIGPRQKNILDQIENGGYLSIKDAREANSMLGKIVRRNPSSSFTEEAIKKAGVLKSFILDRASDPSRVVKKRIMKKVKPEKVTGFRGKGQKISPKYEKVGERYSYFPLGKKLPEALKLNSLNKEYAKVADDVNIVKKKLIDPDSKDFVTRIKETEAEGLGAEGLGKSKNKAEKIITLDRLGKEGKQARSILEKAFIAKSLDVPQTGNFFRLGATMGAGTGIGAMAGMPAVGAAGGAAIGLLPYLSKGPKQMAGAMARGVVGGRRLSRQADKFLKKGNRRIDRGLQMSAPYLDTTSRTMGKVAGREMFNAPQRTPAGNFSQEYQEKLINQRRR